MCQQMVQQEEAEFRQTEFEKEYGICLTACGEISCSNESVFEEAVISHDAVRMCFVVSGKGALHRNKQMLPIHEEMVFLFYPEDRILYRTAFVEPWHLVWIECAGEQCRPLLEELGFRGEIPARRVEKTIIQIARKTISQIREDNEDTLEVRLRRMSLLLDLLAWVASTNPSHPNEINVVPPQKDTEKGGRQGYRHVEFLENYFRENYREEIVMSQLAEKMGITPYYLCHIFQKYKGMSPTEYLSDIRSIEAMRLLEKTNYPITIIAEACGYRNAINFSKFFSRKNGCSPSAYRRNKASPIWTER